MTTEVIGQNFKLSKALQPGTYYIRVRGFFTHRSDAYRLHLRVIGGEPQPESGNVSGFNIEVVHFSEALLSTEHKAAFQRAADRWEEVITGNLRDVRFQALSLTTNGMRPSTLGLPSRT